MEPYFLRPLERLLRFLLLDVLLELLRRRLERVALELLRRDAVLRERDLRALPDDDRRRAVERDRVDVERFRGERRDELLDARLRPRVDVFLVAIPSHSP